MPTTNSNPQKRARKSIAALRQPVVSPSSDSTTPDKTVCYLCGYSGHTRSISIEKNGYSFLRHLTPAPGAFPVNVTTHHAQACHLCALLLDKQRELNRTSTNFFFKGFFRSTGPCSTNLSMTSTTLPDPTDEQELSTPNRSEKHPRRPSEEQPTEMASSSSNPSPVIQETGPSTRSIPPPLRKAVPSTNDSALDHRASTDISSLDTFITSMRSHFLSDYTALISPSHCNSYTACQLCLSIKPHDTLYRISKSQYHFLSTPEINVCTLCYYNLLDQSKDQPDQYRRPRAQCYVCRRRVQFIDWEIKLLETEYLPFLFRLHDDKYRLEHLYDNQRLAVACDQCFYSLLFQYLDQQRRNIPLEQRTYSWQCTFSYENEQLLDRDELFYKSSENKTS